MVAEQFKAGGGRHHADDAVKFIAVGGARGDLGLDVGERLSEQSLRRRLSLPAPGRS